MYFLVHNVYTQISINGRMKDIFSRALLRSYVFCCFDLLDVGGEHSSKECCTSPPDIDVGNNDNPDFQGSAYSRSSSSFLIEDILFQRPKVKFENSSWH